MSHTAEIIIVGAGVQGASLAFHLARRGANVIVLEKRFIGAGATGRSSGLVRMHYDTEVDSRLAWLSFQYFRNWKERVGGEVALPGFTRTGFLQIVESKHARALEANVKMHQQIGIPALLISGDDVRRLAPDLLTDDIELAAYEPESGYAMPTDAAASLLAAARAMGARLIQNCQVTAVLTAGGNISGVETTQGQFSAPVLVNAAGPWAAGVNQLAGLDLPLTTWRHDTMYVVRPPGIGSHPTVIDFSNEMYFRPEGSLTLVGLEDGNPLGEPPETETEHAKKGFVERAIDRLCRRMPAMEGGALHSAHGGYDGITPDQHPMLGAAGPAGFFLDCGHSGTGFKTAPAVGLCMSELILDGASGTIDISSLAPQRFASGALIKGNYENIWR